MKTYYNGPQRRQTGTPSGQKGEQSTRGLNLKFSEVTRLVNRREKGQPDEFKKDSKGVLYNYTVRVLSDARNKGMIKEIPKLKTGD